MMGFSTECTYWLYWWRFCIISTTVRICSILDRLSRSWPLHYLSLLYSHYIYIVKMSYLVCSGGAWSVPFFVLQLWRACSLNSNRCRYEFAKHNGPGTRLSILTPSLDSVAPILDDIILITRVWLVLVRLEIWRYLTVKSGCNSCGRLWKYGQCVKIWASWCNT